MWSDPVTGFFLEKIFRGGKTKFSRNEGGQAKIHKIYVVHTLSTCTEPLSACLSQTGLALALIICSFNFFFNNLLDEGLENIVTVWARKPRRITV